MKYLVGVGNYVSGDDAIGLLIADYIAEHFPHPAFEVVSLPDSGVRLLDYFREDTEKILIVDAVLADRQPGEFFFFTLEDVKSRKFLPRFSTHEGDLLQIFEMGRALGHPVPAIQFMGIQPAGTQPGMEMSPLLRRQLAAYVKAAVSALLPLEDHRRI